MFINPFVHAIKKIETFVYNQIYHELDLKKQYQTGYSGIAKYVIFKKRGDIFFCYLQLATKP